MDVLDRAMWILAAGGVAWMLVPAREPERVARAETVEANASEELPSPVRACLDYHASFEPAPVSRWMHRTGGTKLHTSDGADLPETTEGRYPMKLYCSYVCPDPLRDAVSTGRWDLVDRYAAWFARTGPQTRQTCGAIAYQIDRGRATVQAIARAFVGAHMCSAVEYLRAELAGTWPRGHAAIADIACR